MTMTQPSLHAFNTLIFPDPFSTFVQRPAPQHRIIIGLCPFAQRGTLAGVLAEQCVWAWLNTLAWFGMIRHLATTRQTSPPPRDVMTV